MINYQNQLVDEMQYEIEAMQTFWKMKHDADHCSQNQLK